MKKSIQQRYVPKSLQNLCLARFFQKIIEHLLQKTLKSIKNHAKSDFGLQGGPEASQGLPRTPKILKKLLKMTPDGTRKQWQNAGVQTPVPRIVTSVLGEIKNRFCVRDDQSLPFVFFLRVGGSASHINIILCWYYVFMYIIDLCIIYI